MGKRTPLEKKLLKALEDARDHLDYCNYGDAWESQVRDTLEPKIDAAIAAAYEKNSVKPPEQV